MSGGKVTLKQLNSSPGTKNEAYKWMVYFPADIPGGPRKRKPFKAKTKAVEFQREKQIEVTNAGRDGSALTVSASREAAWAMNALKPYGVGIRKVAEDYITRRLAEDKSISVSDAVEECIEHKHKNGASASHLQTLKFKLSGFTKNFGKRYISDISTKEISRWLNGLTYAPVTRRGYRAVVRGLFSWAEKQGYCEGNPAALTDPPKLKKNREPDIFTPEHLRILLNKTPKELIPVTVVQAFSGLRPGEAGNLDWRDIDRLKKRISVDPIGKTGASHRYVPISPTLLAWLRPFKQKRGDIIPTNYINKIKAFRKALREDKDNPINHVQHTLRHSFASYTMAKIGDAGKVSLLLGHSDKDTLFQHYKKRVTKAEAKKWFGTIPEKGKKIIKMEGAA